MNDQLFEMLLSLFEQALTNRCDQLIDQKASQDLDELSLDRDPFFQEHQAASDKSMRVLTSAEQLKLTKPAIQFLYQFMHTGLVNSFQFEEIMHMILDSEEAYVTLADLREIIHQVLAEFLPAKDLIMLEFALNLETIPTTMH
jgi:uncharacterized protein Smg (DUF494 family)